MNNDTTANAVAPQPCGKNDTPALDAIERHLTNAYDVASKAGDGPAMHSHATALEQVKMAKETVRRAQRALSNVTVEDDSSDSMGQAENYLSTLVGAGA